MTVLKNAVRIALVISLVIGTTGCTLLGEMLGQKQTTPEENHKLQKVAAEEFWKNWPATESVRFTQEGSVTGAGDWAANAIVTVGDREYRQIIGPGTQIGEGLSDLESRAPSEKLSIFYSDGTTEVLTR